VQEKESKILTIKDDYYRYEKEIKYTKEKLQRAEGRLEVLRFELRQG
jgi:hypothetical protein